MLIYGHSAMTDERRKFFIDALSRLRECDVVTPGQLRDWERKAIELLNQLRAGDFGKGELPEIFFHYLMDADIRFKDSRYKKAQESAFDVAFEKLKSNK